MLLFLCPLLVVAGDPPHATNNCASCHLTHNSPGNYLTGVAGNANLCESCHISGGTASAFPFSESDQALAWPGLPTSIVRRGTSHRWDSGVAGHIAFRGGAVSASTGIILPGGTYTGAYPKAYILIITNGGSVGASQFNWSTSLGTGNGTNIPTGTNISLNEGLTVTFVNGTGTSFQVGDQWHIYVRPDLRSPTIGTLITDLNGQVTCSTCHDVHSQALPPYDTNAPAYGGNGTGAGRHYLYASNNLEQMCVDCHAARVVTNALAGSHPVGIVITTGLLYKTTSALPLETGSRKMGCMTCHKIHYAPSTDGDLTRMTNGLAMCVECHLLSDTTTPAAHFSATNPLTLWPGGQYGTTFPQRTNSTDQGTCVNCHHPHGWPVSTNTAVHYPKLLLDLEENVCFTCHDTNGPAIKRTQGDFSKAVRHPVLNTDPLRGTGRSVECNDCHNAHKALSGALNYTNTATSARTQVTNPIKGVSGVTFNYSALTNFQTVATNLYTFLPKPNGATNSLGATNEWQICLKCHSRYGWTAGTAPSGISSNGSVAKPFETDLAQELSPMNFSGHPIVTGLDNYPNSIAVGGKKGLLAGALKAPWNINIGSQTMTCTDCHNSDASSPAAQGPHGSAAQFMLRTFSGGISPTNWPNVTSFAASWCFNCHSDNVGNSIHTRSEHSSARCYGCHLVIPHGGKMSRLIADRDGSMPVRYAYGNTLSTVQMTSFTKAANNGYVEGSCQAACGDPHTGAASENW